MKSAVTLLTAAVLTGLGASTFVHIRGLAGGPGDPWPLIWTVFCAGVALTLLVLLAAWRVGIGRTDGWWSRAMDGLSTGTYLALAAAFLYGLGTVAYFIWSVRRAGSSPAATATVAGATFLFFHAVLFAATRALAIALRTPRA
jgi:hypothetical protein